MENSIHNLSEYGDVLLPKDVQEILQVGRTSVLKLLAEGTLKSVRIGKTYRIPKVYLTEFLYSNNNQGKEDAI